MIKINVLPQESGGKGGPAAAAAPSAPAGGTMTVAIVLLLLYAVVIGGGVWVFGQKIKDADKTRVLTERKNKLTKDVAATKTDYERVKETIDVLNNQIAVLEMLDPQSRLFWAEKLNILPLMVPEGVFLTELKVTEDVKEVETAESKQKRADWQKLPARQRQNTQQPPRVMNTVITQRLEMTGVAYKQDGTSDVRLQLILDYYKALQNLQVKVPSSGLQVSFMNFFEGEIRFDDFTGEKIGGREVTKFKFYLTTLPLTTNLKST